MRDLVVDVPVAPVDLLEMARCEEWRLGAAAVVVARPLWWSRPGDALRGLVTILEESAAIGPELAEQWTRVALSGAVQAFVGLPRVASTLLSALATSLLTAVLSEDAEERHEAAVHHAFGLARDAAHPYGLPDPAAHARAGAELLRRVADEEGRAPGS